MSSRLLSIAAALLISSSLLAADPAPQNIVTNASFEEAVADDGLPKDWNGFHSEPAGGYRYAVVDTAHTGKHSLQVVGKGKFSVVRGPRITIDRALRYRASGWVKIDGEGYCAADVKFHYYGKDGRYLDQSRLTFLTPANKGWHQLNLADQLEQFPDAATIEIALSVAGNADAWFDDLTFTATKEARPAMINWLANGDMEERVADSVAGWGIYAAPGGKVSGGSDDAEHHAGKRSLHVTGTGEWVTGASPQIRIRRDQTYTLTGFAKSKKGRPTIGIAYFKDNEFLGVTTSEELAAGEDWKQLTVTSKLADFPTATHIGAVCSGKEEFDGWFDDLVLTSKKDPDAKALPDLPK